MRTLLILMFALTTSALGQGKTSERIRPNIVVLLADDAGYGDFGFQGSANEDLAPLTPHIDSIARGGARFTQAYMAGCVCSPSRAALLTGRYPQRFGHEQNLPVGHSSGLSLEESTMADRLKGAGLRTALIGKWHLGYPSEYHPNRRGFDWFFGCLQGSRSYFPIEKPTDFRVLQENGRPTPEGGYVTDRLGDGAVQFIEKHREQPFFLLVSFTAPHGPMHAKPEDLESLGHIENLRRRKYAGMVKSLDDNVGKILAALKKAGLTERTLVVFTNDNGGQTSTGANNSPLRGRKGQLLEGGVRVPWAMRWPDRIPAGLVIDDPVISLDLLPTFLAAAGAPRAEGLDGVDLLPRLTGRVDALPERALMWRKDGTGREIAIRRGRWKLHVADRAESEVPMLYDLETDRGESTDRAAEHPDRVAALAQELAAWEKELVPPRWGVK